jgi:hypothetical protein
MNNENASRFSRQSEYSTNIAPGAATSGSYAHMSAFFEQGYGNPFSCVNKGYSEAFRKGTTP